MPMTPDVVSILKKDHQEVEALFKQLEAASSRAVKTKQKLFLQINEALTAHAAAEETVLYPRMEALNMLRHNALEAYEEHRLVKQLLAELSALEGGEAWDAKAKVLMDMVRHHVREEESEYFKVLKSELDTAELRQLGEGIVSCKEEVMASLARGAKEGTPAELPPEMIASPGRPSAQTAAAQ